jgi:hypothetical protein
MKILKAKQSHPKKQIFQISELTYIKSMTPLQELLNGEEMMYPIKVIKHETFNVERMGAQGGFLIQKKMECMER